jgi:sensor domain CHASE-containing protein
LTLGDKGILILYPIPFPSRGGVRVYPKTVKIVFQIKWLKVINGFLEPANIKFTQDSTVALVGKDYFKKVLDLYNATSKTFVT